MDKILITAVGLALSSLVALAIYRYRALVTCQIVSLHEKFRLDPDNNEINFGEGNRTLSLSRVTIRNRGYANIDDFQMDGTLDSNVLRWEVLNTKSISKSTVAASQTGNEVSFSIKTLPVGEKVDIHITTDSRPFFWSFQGGGAKFIVKAEEYHEGRIEGLRFFFGILAISAALYFLAYQMGSWGVL